MIIVTDFGGSKDSNFQPMWIDLEEDYTSCSVAAYSKKKNRVDLLEEWKKHQTFLEILPPILKFIMWFGSRVALSTENSVAFCLQSSAG